jgi:hypothetical protein
LARVFLSSREKSYRATRSVIGKKKRRLERKPPPWQKFWSKVVGVSRSFPQAVAITQTRLAGSNVNHVNH